MRVVEKEVKGDIYITGDQRTTLVPRYVANTICLSHQEVANLNFGYILLLDIGGRRGP